MKRFIRNIPTKKVRDIVADVKKKRTHIVKVMTGNHVCRVCYKKKPHEEMSRVEGGCYPYWICDTHVEAGRTGLRET